MSLKILSSSATMEGLSHRQRKRKTKNRKIRQEAESKEHKSPYEFSFAIMRIGVSQICKSVGFRVTQLSALEALTDIAIKHLQAIARSANSFSNFSNRTESNLFDIVNGLHDLYIVRGFSGASSLHKPHYSLLCSTTLFDLADFSTSTAEVPFAKPIPRKESSELVQSERFHMKDSHIPNWLPRFPDPSTYKRCDSPGKSKNREELWEKSIALENSHGIVIGDDRESNHNGGRSVHEEEKNLELTAERGRVRFWIQNIRVIYILSMQRLIHGRKGAGKRSVKIVDQQWEFVSLRTRRGCLGS